ncbi:MAG: ATP-binding protein [Candidatus Eisenbacteria bacterium]
MNDDRAELQARLEEAERELVRLRKVNAALTRRVERELDQQGGAFALFQTAINLESKVHERTSQLEQALSDLQRNAGDLVTARDQAQAANKAKSEFLATMSHEIRTPLNGVIGVADLLAHTEMAEEQHRLVEIIRSSGEALLSVINDVLDFSKIEAGRMSLEEAPYEPERLVQSVADLFGPRMRAKGLTLVTSVDPLLPKFVLGDPGRLRQVLMNLMGNSVKFTEQGGVRLRVFRPNNADDRYRFEVRDSGIGISPDAQQSLFKAFTQADSSTTRRFGGTGLGLAITRQLVELMGGHIELRSAPGIGSTFFFDLPLRESELMPEESLEELAESFRCRARVLVVEDNKVNQLVARKHLERFGAVVELAANGLEAITAVESGKYDVVFMDCQMPEMDGFEATRELRRRDGPGRTVPILALTANAFSGDELRCREVGMNDFLTKPLRPVTLVRALMRWLPESLLGDSPTERAA